MRVGIPQGLINHWERRRVWRMGLSFTLALMKDEEIGDRSLAFTFIIQNKTHDVYCWCFVWLLLNEAIQFLLERTSYHSHHVCHSTSVQMNPQDACSVLGDCGNMRTNTITIRNAKLWHMSNKNINITSVALLIFKWEQSVCSVFGQYYG